MLRFVSMLALMAVAPVAIGAAVPMQINHQGVVTVNGLRFTGTGDFKFAIVDPGTGNFVWTNDNSTTGTNTEPTAAVMVPVTNGVYSVALGDMVSFTNMTEIPASLFADFDALKLRIWFNDGVNGSQQLSPDQPLTTSPYAFRAAKADTADFANAVPAGAGAIPGEVRMWAGRMAEVPSGWLICNGLPVSRVTYVQLFNVLGQGAIYGAGDGANTFNLPSFGNRSPMGAVQDDGGVPKTNVQGSLVQSGGEATNLLTVAELPAHTHTGVTAGGPIPATPCQDFLNFANNRFGSPPGFHAYTWCESPHAFPLSINLTGGNEPHNNVHPYFAITYIIFTGVE